MHPPSVQYRAFRNTDAPALVNIWNESFPHRGAYTLRSVHSFERWLFSKIYFDPQGLIIAESAGTAIAFMHAGFGPNASQSALDYSSGIICLGAVRLAHRRQKIGTELVRRAEEYLRSRGAIRIQAGSFRGENPFYFGLYGGSNSPGILQSDADALPFMQSLGYRPLRKAHVFQRRLDHSTAVIDPRFIALRRRYEAQALPRPKAGTWWQENVLSMMEPFKYQLVEKCSGEVVAQALYWEMEGFGWRWGVPSVGIMDVHVREELRKIGLAKFLLSNLLRHIQEQYFGIVEMQVPEENVPTLGLFRSLGFQHVDTGFGYAKPI